MERSPRLELAVELLLLVGGVAYLVVMLGYPRNAGLVPSIASVVMIGTVLVQMARRYALGRRVRSAQEAEDPPGDRAGQGPSTAHIETPGEFEGLIGDPGMDRAARGRLVAVGAWTVVAVLAAQLLGFVVGAVLSVVGFLLVARQPLRIITITTVVVALGVYAITDVVIGIPWNDAPLLQMLTG